VAAILTGFLLIPELGVNRLLQLTAVALFAAAAISRFGLGSRGMMALLVAAGAGALVVRSASGPLTPGVLAKQESAYSELRVIEHHGFRYLLIDGGAHTIFNAESFEPHQSYVYVAEIAADLSRPRGRLLLVGLGGGGTAEVFARRGWKVDAVEIDPEVPRLAAKYFRLQPFHANVVIAEGRQFLQRSHDQWDVVFFDAFGSASIPFHLVTREAFAAARARLVPGGIFVLNVETVGWQDPLAHSLVATLRTQFRNVIALPTAEPPNQLGNVILMASDRVLDLTPQQLGDPVAALEDEDEHFRVVSRMHAWNNQYQPDRGRVLTDDWNPVDLRAEEINRVAREALRKLLPDSLVQG
jgi:spermidine synthase